MARITQKKVSNLRVGNVSKWDIFFPDAPEPFDEYFPATDVEFPMYGLNSHIFEAGIKQYAVPLKGTLHKLKITFTDSIKHTLAEWLVKWVEEDILNNGEYVSTISTIAKAVYVERLQEDNTVITDLTRKYWVYPDEEQLIVGKSSADSPLYNVEFKIVGHIK